MTARAIFSASPFSASSWLAIMFSMCSFILAAIAPGVVAAGAQTFGLATSRLIGKSIAVVLDGRILTAPVVMEPIRGGRLRINGIRTARQAREMAAMLQVCALPAPFKLIIQAKTSDKP